MNPEYFRDNGGIFLEEVIFKQEYKLISQGQPIARIRIDSSTGGREIIRKLSEEQFDFSFGGVPAMLHFIDQGVPIKILAPVMAEGAGLVVHNDLAAENWNEFVALVRKRSTPLRIGYKMEISTHNLIFERALAEEKIAFGKQAKEPMIKIRILNLHGAKNLIPALENKLIDGFVVNQPFLALAEATGTGKAIALFKDLPPAGKWQGHPCCALAAKESYVEKNPKITEAMVTLLLRANRFLGENPQQSQVQIARWLGLSPEVERRSIPTILFTTELDEEWNAGVRFWVESMIESGKLDKHIKNALVHDQLEETIYDPEVYQKARGNL